MVAMYCTFNWHRTTLSLCTLHLTATTDAVGNVYFTDTDWHCRHVLYTYLSLAPADYMYILYKSLYPIIYPRWGSFTFGRTKYWYVPSSDVYGLQETWRQLWNQEIAIVFLFFFFMGGRSKEVEWKTRSQTYFTNKKKTVTCTSSPLRNWKVSRQIIKVPNV